MIVYYVVLGLIVLIIINYIFLYNKKLIFGEYVIDKDAMSLLLSGTVLTIVAGLRYNVGTDYLAYIINYEEYKTLKFQNIGCSFVAKLSEHIYDDYSTWFFLMSLITVGFCIFAIKKHSRIWPLSIILYLFMGYWHLSFNIVKQCVSMAIIIAYQEHLYDKNIFKWIFVCLVASLFHISALFMIPIYFLVIRKINIRQLIIIVFVGIVISLGYQQLFEIISFLKGNAGTESLTSAVGAREVNVLRILVNIAPTFLLLFIRSSFDNEDMELRVLSNFSILNAVLSIAASKSVYLTRFCNYTGIFNLFFIPFIVRKISKKNQLLVCSIMIICYFVFWIYDLSKGSTTSVFQWIFER